MREAKIGEKDPVGTRSVLGEVIRSEIKQIIIEAMQDVFINIPTTAESELLTPEQLAARLQVPLSWVYEQSRHDKIPTHRVGRYIRFHIREVLQHLEDAARVDSSIRKAG